MTQHTQTAPHAGTALLDIASISEKLNEIYADLAPEHKPDFIGISKQYVGWRTDQVTANNFYNEVMISQARWVPQPTVVDPWDQPQAAAPAPVAAPVIQEPQVPSAPVPVTPVAAPVAAVPEPAAPTPDTGDSAVPTDGHQDEAEQAGDENRNDEEEVETGPEEVEPTTDDATEADPGELNSETLEVVMPVTNPSSLFTQLRALYGTSGGYSITGSFLEDGLHRLVIMDSGTGDKRLPALMFNSTDEQFDTWLAPLLAQQLVQPVTQARSLADQVSSAGKDAAKAVKKSAGSAPKPATGSAASKTASAKATPTKVEPEKPVSTTAHLTIRADQAVNATASYRAAPGSTGTSGKIDVKAGVSSKLKLAPGEWVITLKADGFLDAEQRVTLKAGTDETLEFPLQTAGMF